jgi:hypothetical protein
MTPNKGFCPFCTCTGWEICSHFVGYARGQNVFCEADTRYGGICKKERPLKPADVSVPTGVSIRVYSKAHRAKESP